MMSWTDVADDGSADPRLKDCAWRIDNQAPLLANGAEAWCDPLAITPILEHAAPELLAVVRKVFESSSRGVRHEAVLMVKTA